MAMLEYECTKCNWWGMGNEIVLDCPECGERVAVFSDETPERESWWDDEEPEEEAHP